MDPLENPFASWAEAARNLSDRFVIELGSERPFGPYVSGIVGKLEALATQCHHLSLALERLPETDPAAFEAFLRALEAS